MERSTYINSQKLAPASPSRDSGEDDGRSLATRIGVVTRNAFESTRAGLGNAASVAARKMAALVRYSLQVCRATSRSLPKIRSVIKAIAVLKLFKWLDMASNLFAQGGDIEEIADGIHLQDVRGVANSVSNFALHTLEAFDGFVMGWEGLASLNAVAEVGFFAAISAPLGMFISMYSGVKTTLTTVDNRDFIERLRYVEREILDERPIEEYAEMRRSLLHYLEDEVGITSAELHEIQRLADSIGEEVDKDLFLSGERAKLLQRKFKAASRSSDREVAAQLQKLYLLISKGELDDKKIAEIRVCFETSRKVVSRTLGSNVASIITDYVIFIALLLIVTGVPAVAGLALLLLAVVIGLSNLGYRHYFKNRGIEFPDLDEIFSRKSLEEKTLSHHLVAPPVDDSVQSPEGS